MADRLLRFILICKIEPNRIPISILGNAVYAYARRRDRHLMTDRLAEETKTLRPAPEVWRGAEGLESTLKERYAEMITRLEGVADCEEAAAVLPDLADREERFGRFCTAIAEMANPLLDELLSAYVSACRRARLKPSDHRDAAAHVMESLVDYLMQLVRLHTAAFEESEGVSPERLTLDGLEVHLRRVVADRLESLLRYD